MQIARNKAMTFTSLFSITAMLLILGMFFILAVNVNLITESAKDQFDMVEIFLLDEADDDDIASLRDELSDSPYVDSVAYLSKEDAMSEMKSRWGDNAYLLDGVDELSGNPLPRSLRVQLVSVEDSEKLVEFIGGLENPSIERIESSQEEINKILRITNGIQIGAIVVIVFLIIVSVVVVSNTIKLTVLARGREIRIMKYVGATNWFVRGPFLAEGIVIGLISALISAGIVGFLYSMLTVNWSQQMLVLFRTSLVPVSFMTGNLIVIFLALGVSIGAVGSLISMRRFLEA